jgi:hypothetical protein
MKRLFIFGVLAAAVYLAWGFYFARPEPNHPILRLSLFVDDHVDEILGPLPLGTEELVAAPSHTHGLRLLRENIRDLATTASPAESLRYATAVQLCDELLRASEERERHLVRLNDTRAKNNVSPLAVDPLKHKAERLAFFENGIALSWHEAVRKLRAAIDNRYRQLRELERSR